MSPATPLSVLILCTGNSCRSILGEALFRDLGVGRFVAHSAGSQPVGRVNPGAIRKLQDEGHAIEGLASKSWLNFAGVAAQPLDIVVTVCDSAAGESCPLWNGAPVIVHWGIPDPANAPADRLDVAFDFTYQQLRKRVENVMELPWESLDPRQHQDALLRIHDAVSAEERRIQAG